MPAQMQFEVPQEPVVSWHEQTHGQCQQLPALHEAVCGRVAFTVHREQWRLKRFHNYDIFRTEINK